MGDCLRKKKMILISNCHIKCLNLHSESSEGSINSQMFIELYFVKAQFSSDKHHYTEVQALVIIHIQLLHKM